MALLHTQYAEDRARTLRRGECLQLERESARHSPVSPRNDQTGDNAAGSTASGRHEPSGTLAGMTFLRRRGQWPVVARDTGRWREGETSVALEVGRQNSAGTTDDRRRQSAFDQISASSLFYSLCHPPTFLCLLKVHPKDVCSILPDDVDAFTAPAMGMPKMPTALTVAKSLRDCHLVHPKCKTI